MNPIQTRPDQDSARQPASVSPAASTPPFLRHIESGSRHDFLELAARPDPEVVWAKILEATEPPAVLR